MATDCRGCTLVAQKDRTARQAIDRCRHLEKALRAAESERRELAIEAAHLRDENRRLREKVSRLG